jgi:hypothetical protein
MGKSYQWDSAAQKQICVAVNWAKLGSIDVFEIAVAYASRTCQQSESNIFKHGELDNEFRNIDLSCIFIWKWKIDLRWCCML